MTDAVITGDIKLYGFKELETVLHNLAGNAGLKILQDTWKASIKPMQQEIIQRAPTGPSGELKRSILIRKARRSEYPVAYQIYVRGKRTAKNKETGKRDIIGGAWYARFVELGAKAHWMPKEYIASVKSKRFRRLAGLEKGEGALVSSKEIHYQEKKYMVFWVNGRKIIVTHVWHPGIEVGVKGRPFMRPVFDERRQSTIDNFGSNLVHAIQAYFRGNPVGMGMAETLSAGVM